MKQERTRLRRATRLLIAAAALPLTPLAAQETQPPADTPVSETTTPPPTPEPEPQPAPEPVQTEAEAPPVAVQPTIQTPVRRTTNSRITTTRAAPPRTAAPRAAPVRAAAPAPAPLAPDAPASPAAELAPETVPAPAAAAPEALPQPAPPTAAPAAQPALAEGIGSILPWLLGVLALGALAFFLVRRRRRRADAEVYEETYEERYEEAPAEAAYEAPAAAISAAAPPAAAPMAFDDADEPAAATATETGEPRLDLILNPVRAGVTGEEARVEFQLTVANQGTAAARDVRVSAFMLPSGGARSSEAERMLIDQGDEAGLPETAIEPGSGKRIEAAVELPTSAVDGDSVLPVVVAEARYLLPDGSEARTSASFAVGVPDGEELAHFAIDNPSGLHEDVEARQLGEAEHA
jgi:hypothetical protein